MWHSLVSPKAGNTSFSASVDGGLCPLAGQKGQELWQRKVCADWFSGSMLGLVGTSQDYLEEVRYGGGVP